MGKLNAIWIVWILAACSQQAADDSAVKDTSTITTTKTSESQNIPDKIKEEIAEEEALTPEKFLITFPTRYIKVAEPLATWAKAPTVKDYDVLVTMDEACKVPLHFYGDIEGEQQQIEEIPDGEYYFCLYAIQEKSAMLAAKNSPLLFEVDTIAPPAPTLVALSATSHIADTTPTVTWNATAETDYYDLYVTSDQACKNKLQSHEDLTETTATLSTLDEGTYYLCLYSKDFADNITPATNNALVFTVDVTSPKITSVTSTSPDGRYGLGTQVSITVNFDEIVVASDPSQLNLKLETGVTDNQATYQSGNSSKSLVFSYTIVAGDDTADLATFDANALSLGTASVADRAGNLLVNSIPSTPASVTLAGAKTLILDGIPPTVLEVTSSTGDGYYNEGDDISLQVKWSEIVAMTSPEVTKLTVDVAPQLASYTGGADSDTLSYEYTVQAGDASVDLSTHANGIVLNAGTIKDLAGNAADLDLSASPLSANQNIVVDTSNPDDPSAPTDIGSYTNNTTVNFDWTVPNDTVSGIGSYYLQVGTSPAANDVFDGNVGNVLTYDVTGADGSVLYARVKAIDKAGNESGFSNDSNGIEVDTTTPDVPDAPTDDGAYTGNTTVTFDWTAAADGGSGIASYYLQVGTSAGGNDVYDGNVGNVLTHDIVGSDGVTYYARVKAIDKAANQSNYSANSDGIEVDTTAPAQPAAPTDAGVATANSTITFTWAAPNETGSGIASYFLQVGTSAGGNDVYDGNVGNVLTHDISGSEGVTYYARVKAIDLVGNESAYSSNSDGIMLDSTAPDDPAAPTDVGAATNNATVTFTWVAPNDAGSGIASYYLQVGTSAGASDVYDGNVGNVLTHDINGVNGTSYFAKVKAIDKAGNESNYSANSNGIEVDTTNPGAFNVTGPANPVYTSPQTVSFDASSDAISYNLIVSSVADCGNPSHVAASPYNGITASQDVSLSDGLYYACITAVDDAGNQTAATNNPYAFEVESSITFVSYTTFDGVDYRIVVSETEAGSSTAENIDTSASGILTQSSLALDSADKVHVSYAKLNGALYDLHYAKNSSGSFVAESVEGGASDDDVGFGNSIALESNDTAHIVYRFAFDDTVTTADRLVASSGTAGSFTLTDPAIESLTGAGEEFKSQTVAVDGTDKAHIVYTYFDGSNYTLGHRDDGGGWASGTDEFITNASCDDIVMGDLAIDSQNILHLVYSCVTTGGDCKVYHATNDAGWTHTEVGTIKLSCTASDLTELNRPVLVVDSSDKVHIAFFNQDDTELTYATNLSGTFATELVRAGEGWEPAIALDSADKVYIYYLSGGGGAANLRRSTNNSGSWVQSTIDGSGNVTGVGGAAVQGVAGRSNR
jgi:hypothetical protein